MLYIDKLKALAMLLVVWGHTMYFCMYHEQADNSDPVLSIICTFHVPLFFFLSGFVISHPPGITKFLRKARKFLVPMLVVGFVNALLFGGMREFFLDSGHFGYWYLLTLTIFYLLLVPFKHTDNKKNNVKLFLADSGMAIAFWLVMYFSTDSPSAIISALNPWGAFAYWPFFFIGYICRKYSLTDYIIGKPWLTVFLLVAYLILLVSSFSHIDSLPLALELTIALTAIAALVALFFHFGDSRTFIDRLLLLIGNSTLNIYIYHYFFIRIINLEFLKTQSLPIEMAVTITLTIIIACGLISVSKLIRLLIAKFSKLRFLVR